MMAWAALGLMLALTAEPSARAEKVEHLIGVSTTSAGECVATFDGKEVPWRPNAGPDFPKVPKGDALRITSLTPDVSWECAGGAIYAAQQAGYPLKIDFISEPPPAKDQ